MKLFFRFIDVFLYTSLLTACCATGLCMATERLINGTAPALFSDLHILVFGSSLLVYNTPRLMKRPDGRPHTSPYRPWHFFFFFAGILLTTIGLYRMPWQMIAASSILGLFAFAYFLPLLPFTSKRRLRDFGWLKITVLAGVWTMATSVLPILYWQKSIGQYPYEIFIRLAFIFTLCIIFDIRDMQADRNINTLPQKFGTTNSYRLIDITLVLFVALSAMQYMRYPDKERLAGAILTAIITRVVATYLRRKPSDRAYLLLADGVMIVYSLLVLIPLP